MKQKKKSSKDSKEQLNAKFDLLITPPAFTVLADSILINANQQSILEITYLPFHSGTQECMLLFHDPNVGEFMYRIEGTALCPVSIEHFNWFCKANTPLEKSLRVTPNNALRDKALNGFIQTNARRRDMQAKSGSNKIKLATNDRESYAFPKQPLKYTVEYSSSFFTGPSEIIIRPSADGKEKTAIENIYTDLPIIFHPKVIKIN